MHSMLVDSDNIYAECSLPFHKLIIRALNLKPGDGNDQIQGTLRLLDLDTEPTPQHECVSYVWGDSKSTRSATINEKYITITKNL